MKDNGVTFLSWSAQYFAKYLAKLSGNRYGGMRKLCGPADGVDDKDCRSYVNRNVFIVGLYHPDNPRWYKIKCKRAVVLLAGSDIEELECLDESSRNNLFSFLRKKNITFATESSIIQKSIENKFGLITEIVYLPSAHEFPAKPLPMPKSFNIGCYIGDSKYYHRDLIVEIAREMPNVIFHFYSLDGYRATEKEGLENIRCYTTLIQDMPKFLSKMSCGLRVTKHDTYSMSAIEYNMAGRWFINNHEMPHCIKLNHSPSKQEVVDRINELQNEDINWIGQSFYRKYHNRKSFIKKLIQLGLIKK